MKKYVVTIDCSGLIKQVSVLAGSANEAKVIAQKQNPNCKILDCEEQINS